ncbi:MAG: hypothetical protein QM733_18595 [Ilumatobacteraceae bacterium]
MIGDNTAALSAIGQRLQRNAQQLSVTRAWLIDNGYIHAPQRGQLAFVHPALAAVIATDPALAHWTPRWTNQRRAPLTTSLNPALGHGPTNTR